MPFAYRPIGGTRGRLSLVEKGMLVRIMRNPMTPNEKSSVLDAVANVELALGTLESFNRFSCQVRIKQIYPAYKEAETPLFQLSVNEVCEVNSLLLAKRHLRLSPTLVLPSPPSPSSPLSSLSKEDRDRQLMPPPPAPIKSKKRCQLLPDGEEADEAETGPKKLKFDDVTIASVEKTKTTTTTAEQSKVLKKISKAVYSHDGVKLYRQIRELKALGLDLNHGYEELGGDTIPQFMVRVMKVDFFLRTLNEAEKSGLAPFDPLVENADGENCYGLVQQFLVPSRDRLVQMETRRILDYLKHLGNAF